MPAAIVRAGSALGGPVVETDVTASRRVATPVRRQHRSRRLFTGVAALSAALLAAGIAVGPTRGSPRPADAASDEDARPSGGPVRTPTPIPATAASAPGVDGPATPEGGFLS